MGEQSIRHSEPVSRRRTRGARRLIAYSPRVQLHSRVAFDLWLVLEADPNVIYFCERPIRLLTETGERVIDFWSRDANSETYWCIGDAPANMVEPATLNRIPIHYVPLPQLAADGQWARSSTRMKASLRARRMWIRNNWQSYWGSVGATSRPACCIRFTPRRICAFVSAV